ncbi:MAG: hypothetical protein QNK37_01020 [Acidobacteriota bacterium]|nr:hypothetical protein [Acidobacteriota bacterium]
MQPTAGDGQPGLFDEVSISIYFDYSSSFVDKHREELASLNNSLDGLLRGMFERDLENVVVYYFDGNIATSSKSLNSVGDLDGFAFPTGANTNIGGYETNLVRVFRQISRKTSFNHISLVISDFVHEEVNCSNRAQRSTNCNREKGPEDQTGCCLEENRASFLHYLDDAVSELGDTMIFLIDLDWVPPKSVRGRFIETIPLASDIQQKLSGPGFIRTIRAGELSYGRFARDFMNLKREKVETVGAFFTGGNKEQIAITLKGSGLHIDDISGLKVKSNNLNERDLSGYMLLGNLPLGDLLVLIDNPGSVNLRRGESIMLKVVYGDGFESKWTPSMVLEDTGYVVTYNKVTLLPNVSGKEYGYQVRIMQEGSAGQRLEGRLFDDENLIGTLDRRNGVNPVQLWTVLDPDVNGIGNKVAFGLQYRLENASKHIIRVGSFERNNAYDGFRNFTLKWSLYSTVFIMLIFTIIDRLKIKTPRRFSDYWGLLLPNAGIVAGCMPSYFFSFINTYLYYDGAWMKPTSSLFLHLMFALGGSSLLTALCSNLARMAAQRRFDRHDWGKISGQTTPEAYADKLTFRTKTFVSLFWFGFSILFFLLLQPYI